MGKLEDVPVEKLANAILLQLARRDIMVFDVDISEFVKRKVSFKETKGGILIKNKRFMLDGTVEVVAEVEEEEEEGEGESPPRKRTQMRDLPKDLPSRYEVFDSDDPAVAYKFSLTQGRKYGILSEQSAPQKVNDNGMMTELMGINYTVINDDGQRVHVPSMCFTIEQRLVGMGQPQARSGGRLSYMGSNEFSMPVLR